MAIKEETLAFSKVSASESNRIEDRVSFLYLEYVKIVQNSSGVVALSEEDGVYLARVLQIPIGGITAILLGPGTSITQAAITSCARMSCTVIFAGGGGFPENSSIIALTTTSKWAQAQAKIVSNDTIARKVAKEFYRKQFSSSAFEGSIAQMRALEGSLMKKAYAFEANRNNVKGFRRNTLAEDNVNVALNICNGILYGLCAGVTQALALNPALGVIHRGNAKSFLFDLADWYKPSIAIPVSFSVAHAPPEHVASLARRALRKEIERKKLMKDIVNSLLEILAPYTPEREDERLIGLSNEVSGHKNYGVENDSFTA